MLGASTYAFQEQPREPLEGPPTRGAFCVRSRYDGAVDLEPDDDDNEITVSAPVVPLPLDDEPLYAYAGLLLYLAHSKTDAFPKPSYGYVSDRTRAETVLRKDKDTKKSALVQQHYDRTTVGGWATRYRWKERLPAAPWHPRQAVVVEIALAHLRRFKQYPGDEWRRRMRDWDLSVAVREQRTAAQADGNDYAVRLLSGLDEVARTAEAPRRDLPGGPVVVPFRAVLPPQPAPSEPDVKAPEAPTKSAEAPKQAPTAKMPPLPGDSTVDLAAERRKQDAQRARDEAQRALDDLGSAKYAKMQVAAIDLAVTKALQGVNSGAIKPKVSDLPGLVRVRNFILDRQRSGMDSATAGMLLPETVRMRDAKKTGDVDKVIEALEQDNDDIRIYIDQLRASREQAKRKNEQRKAARLRAANADADG
jgi:hypothetical protein